MCTNASKEHLYVVKEFKSSVQQLDAYIKSYERPHRSIVAKKYLSKYQTRLLKYIDRLIETIEREEIKKKEVFGHLKASNEAMKETISKLQDSSKTYRRSVRAEFKKLDALNTERLLNIDPRYI